MSRAAVQVDRHLKRLEELLADGKQPQAASVLGQMVAVSGAQAVIRFAQTAGDSDISVGTYLGIEAGT